MADLLSIDERNDLGIAAVMARKGIHGDAIGARLGRSMPSGPSAVSNGTEVSVGTGPGVWLLLQEGASGDFADCLQDRLAGLASVSDQSSGYVVFRLSGPGASIVLQRGTPVDFHPSVFRPGSAATSVIAHIGVIIWQVDEGPTYDVAVFRSLSRSFRHWLDQAALAL